MKKFCEYFRAYRDSQITFFFFLLFFYFETTIFCGIYVSNPVFWLANTRVFWQFLVFSANQNRSSLQGQRGQKKVRTLWITSANFESWKIFILPKNVKSVSLIHYSNVALVVWGKLVSQLEKGAVASRRSEFLVKIFANVGILLLCWLRKKTWSDNKTPITTLFSRERTFDIDFSLIIQQAKLACVCRFPSLRWLHVPPWGRLNGFTLFNGYFFNNKNYYELSFALVTWTSFAGLHTDNFRRCTYLSLCLQVSLHTFTEKLSLDLFVVVLHWIDLNVLQNMPYYYSLN